MKNTLIAYFVTIKALFSYCSMEVFLPIATQQTLTVIPRWNSPIVSLRVSNEETGEIELFSIPTTTYNNGYLSMDFTYDFKEGGRYVLEIKYGKDTQGDDQKKYEQDITKAGGVYLIVRNMDSFIDWYDNFVGEIQFKDY